jgi:hypothetical protein
MQLILTGASSPKIESIGRSNAKAARNSQGFPSGRKASVRNCKAPTKACAHRGYSSLNGNLVATFKDEPYPRIKLQLRQPGWRLGRR